MSGSASQGAAAADAGEGLPGAVTRHVTNYDGTYWEAVDDGLIEKPPPVEWRDWQKYRRITGTHPNEEEDGPQYVYGKYSRHEDTCTQRL